MKVFREQRIVYKAFKEYHPQGYIMPSESYKSENTEIIQSAHIDGVYQYQVTSDDEGNTYYKKNYDVKIYSFIKALRTDKQVSIIDLTHNIFITTSELIALFEVLVENERLPLECLLLSCGFNVEATVALIRLIVRKPSLKILGLKYCRDLFPALAKNHNESICNALLIKYFQHAVSNSQLRHLTLPEIEYVHFYEFIENFDRNNTSLCEFYISIHNSKRIALPFKAAIISNFSTLLSRNRAIENISELVASLEDMHVLQNNHLDLSCLVISALDFTRLVDALIANKNIVIEKLSLIGVLQDFSLEAEIKYIQGLIKLLSAKHTIRKIDLSNNRFRRRQTFIAFARALNHNYSLVALIMENVHCDPLSLQLFLDELKDNHSLMEIKLSTKQKTHSFQKTLNKRSKIIAKRNHKHTKQLLKAIDKKSDTAVQLALDAGADPFACGEQKYKFFSIARRRRSLILELDDIPSSDAKKLKGKEKLNFDEDVERVLLHAQRKLKKEREKVDTMILEELQQDSKVLKPILPYQFDMEQYLINQSGAKKTLNLSGIRIKARDFEKLIHIILANDEIIFEKFNLIGSLQMNSIDAEWIYLKSLVKLLCHMHSLRELNISSNSFSYSQALLMLAQALAQNCYLNKFVMEGKLIRPSVMEEFVSIIEKNNSLMAIKISSKGCKQRNKRVKKRLRLLVQRNQTNTAMLLKAIHVGILDDVQQALQAGANPFVCAEQKRKLLKFASRRRSLVLELEAITDTETMTTVGKEHVDFDTHIEQVLKQAQRKVQKAAKNVDTLIAECLKQQAIADDSYAQYLLAQQYLSGEGVQKSEEMAYQWFSKAAKQVHIQSLYQMGMMHLHGYLDELDAVDLLKKAGEEGHTDAFYELGIYHYQKNNYLLARQNLLKASQRGHYAALVKIGIINAASYSKMFLQNPISIIEDMIYKSNAFAHMLHKPELAAKKIKFETKFDQPDIADTQITHDSNSVTLYFKYQFEAYQVVVPIINIYKYRFPPDIIFDEQLYFQNMLRGAKKGKNLCQFIVSLLYMHGKGVEKNIVESFQWCKRSAKFPSQNSNAHFQMYWHYQYGQGTKQDKKKALKWLIKASTLKHAVATYKLSQYCLHGEYVKLNTIKALSLCASAAKLGYFDAYYQLAQMHLSGIGCKKNRVLAIGYLIKASSYGHKKACYDLAKIFCSYRNYIQYLENIVCYYILAAKHGCAEAYYELGMLHNRSELGFFHNRGMAKQYFVKANQLGCEVGQSDINQVDSEVASQSSDEEQLEQDIALDKEEFMSRLAQLEAVDSTLSFSSDDSDTEERVSSFAYS